MLLHRPVLAAILAFLATGCATLSSSRARSGALVCAADEWITDDHCCPAGEGFLADANRCVNLQARCEQDDALACRWLGESNLRGTGMKADPTNAAAYFHIACSLNDAPACVTLALMEELGEGVNVHPEDAFDLRVKACELGSGVACLDLAAMYEQGHGVDADPKQAMSIYSHACQENIPDGCGRLGAMLLMMDVEQGAMLLERACQLGSTFACERLGILYHDGDGVPQNDRHALELSRRACEAGSGDACSDVGDLFSDSKMIVQDFSLAAQMYERGCAAGSAAACDSLGAMKIEGRGVTKNVNEGIKILERACKSDGVTVLTDDAMRNQVMERNRCEAEKVACSDSWAISCDRLGKLFSDGTELPARPDEAFEWFTLGCNHGIGEACFGRGMMLEDVQPDLTGPSFEKACQLGFSPACTSVAEPKTVLQRGYGP